MPLDPQIAALLALAAGAPRTEAMAVPDARAQYEARIAAMPPAAPVAGVTERSIEGPGGPLRLRIYTPPGQGPFPLMVFFHGSGFVLCSLDTHDGICRNLCAGSGCLVVSVDYRLAPETPHPGPVEDCHAALQWLRGQAAELGVDPGRVAVMGESAGGGLAAALALLARDRGEVPFILQVLVAPMIDDRTTVRADVGPYTGEFIWTREHNLFGWTCLLGGPPGGPDVSPYAAAARAEDLAGLPPTFINLGDLDLFVEEAMDYSRRLLRAGVPVELHVYPGLIHGGGMMAQSRLAKVSARDVVDALRRAFAPSGAGLG